MFKLIVREELDMASADRSTLFINATILDGSEHMEPQPDMAVAVERGVITWMGTGEFAGRLSHGFFGELGSRSAPSG